MLRRVTGLAVVYGVLIVTVAAQEPLRKAGVSPPPAPAKEDLRWLPQRWTSILSRLMKQSALLVPVRGALATTTNVQPSTNPSKHEN